MILDTANPAANQAQTRRNRHHPGKSTQKVLDSVSRWKRCPVAKNVKNVTRHNCYESERKMATKRNKITPEFTRTREFIRRYIVTPTEADLDVLAVWVMGTWTFSPACTNPATYPYLYIAAEKGSGKTLLGQDIFGCLCRNHTPTVGITGAGVFRLMGEMPEDDSNEIISTSPTLAIDEIDATYSGAKDEPLRQMLNAGYKRGAKVPRTKNNVVYMFPVYSPKVLMGIDNGHLPDTVTDRAIRIDLTRATPEQMQTIEPFYSFDVEYEAAELQQALSDWAKDHSLVLREYRPEPIEGFQPRQWEISRSLVQLAREIGIEPRIRKALHEIMTRNPDKPGGKVGLYRAIYQLFEEDLAGIGQVTTRQIMEKLDASGVRVPGQSGTGLASVLSENGIAPTLLRLPEGHPGIPEKDKPVQRGYWRHQFDGVFLRYLFSDDE